MTLSVLDTNKSNFTTGRAGGLLLCHSVVLSQNELFSGAVRVNKHNDNKKTKRMMPLGVLTSVGSKFMTLSVLDTKWPSEA